MKNKYIGGGSYNGPLYFCVVPGGSGCLRVLSAVICTFFRRGRILALGRINMVTGGAGGMTVHSSVIYTPFPRGRLLALGRSGYWWNDRPAVGSFCHFLISHSLATNYISGAIMVIGGTDRTPVPSLVL